jgi:hypothetical protein
MKINFNSPGNSSSEAISPKYSPRNFNNRGGLNQTFMNKSFHK